ncbi:hypothetical protein GCM10029976_067010 [Kribbella albertanoniae]|uniref:Uncharacterized protein n=1 Tax=Kribbella albertanoniae TaxID=1266829 RepID=A0A4R4QKF7_9ACTN|nr:hypothetical protein [Kribbella albertanoniae]TDC35813.1 hypothetical protein E1261_00355 [Kribbella albertanoniae]
MSQESQGEIDAAWQAMKLKHGCVCLKNQTSPECNLHKDQKEISVMFQGLFDKAADITDIEFSHRMDALHIDIYGEA